MAYRRGYDVNHITCNSTDSNYTWEIIDCCDNSARLLLPELRVRCRSVDRFLLQQLMMLDYCTVHMLQTLRCL